MKVGNKVIVKANLEEELRKLTFDEFTCKHMAEHFVGTEQEVFALWKNEDGQEYQGFQRLKKPMKTTFHLVVKVGEKNILGFRK